MILTLFVGDYNLLLYVVFKIYLLTILNASASASPPLNLQKGQMSVSRRSLPYPAHGTKTQRPLWVGGRHALTTVSAVMKRP